MKIHEHYEMLISRYKDKDLNYNEIIEMNKHLESCESCRKFMKDIDSISAMLLGNKSIIVNKVKHRIYPYIISIAAAILIFVGVGIILNYNLKNNSELIISNTNTPSVFQDIDGDGYVEYTPLFSYFNEDSEYTNNDEMIILSSYMYYMGED